MSDTRDDVAAVGDGFAIFEPDVELDPMKGEPQERYFAVVVHKSVDAKADPIPWLCAIYRGELVEAYWRGTADEAQDALTEYLAGLPSDV